MGKRRAIETLFLTLLHHLSKLVHMYTDDSPKIYPYFIISFQKKHFFLCVEGTVLYHQIHQKTAEIANFAGLSRSY